MALRDRLPLVMVLSSSGSEVSEGIDALHGWGRAAAAVAACSGSVPVLAAVTGAAISGPSLLLGLADVTVMTPDAFAFVSGSRRRRGVHGNAGQPARPGRGGGARQCERAVRAGGRGRGRRRRICSPRCSTTSPTTPTPSRRASASDDPTDRSSPAAPGPRPRRRIGLLRRARRRARHRRRRRPPGAATRVGVAARHRLGLGRRQARRRGGQPAPLLGGHPRHPRLAERRPFRTLLRLVQPAHRHPRRHPGVPPRQGPRVEGDDPSRRRARLRLRRGESAACSCRTAQGLRRGLHRHGLQGHRQRPVPGVAVGGDRRHGGPRCGADPQPQCRRGRTPRAWRSATTPSC